METYEHDIPDEMSICSDELSSHPTKLNYDISHFFPVCMNSDLLPNAAVRRRILSNIEIKGSRIDDMNPCILWKGYKNGRITVCGTEMRCSRFVYEYCVGKIRKTDIIRQICKKDRMCLQHKHLIKISTTPNEREKKARKIRYSISRNENRIKKKMECKRLSKKVKVRLKNNFRLNGMISFL